MKKKTTMLKKKVSYFQYKVLENKKHIDKRLYLIDQYTQRYNLNRSELYGILLLEYVNRGGGITKFLEKIVTLFVPRVAVRLNLSLGIAQIKISTAKKFYPEYNARIIAKKLIMDEEFNIGVCAQIINNYYNSPDKLYTLLGLVKEYTTGKRDSKENISITMYYILLKWIIEENLVSK